MDKGKRLRSRQVEQLVDRLCSDARESERRMVVAPATGNSSWNLREDSHSPIRPAGATAQRRTSSSGSVSAGSTQGSTRSHLMSANAAQLREELKQVSSREDENMLQYAQLTYTGGVRRRWRRRGRRTRIRRGAAHAARASSGQAAHPEQTSDWCDR